MCILAKRSLIHSGNIQPSNPHNSQRGDAGKYKIIVQELWDRERSNPSRKPATITSGAYSVAAWLAHRVTTAAEC